MGLIVTLREQHASQRAFERHGRHLSNKLKTRLVKEIKRSMRRAPGRDRTDLVAHPQARCGEDGRQRWDVKIDGKTWRVVYHTRERFIITVLPDYGQSYREPPK